MFLSMRQMAGPAKHHFQNQWCFSFKIYRTRIEIRTDRKPTSIRLDNVEQGRPDNPITNAGGVADISRWCKPPVPTTKCGEPRQGRRNGHHAISAAPAGAWINCSRPTGGLHHRLMSNVPSGQVAVFPALILDM